MAEHLEDCAIHACAGEAVDAQHHEAEVADRRVGDQFLHVRLDERDQRAVDDADNSEGDDPRRVRCASAGKSPELSPTSRRSPSSANSASSTEPAVGDLTCASGSQVWNGKSGTLTAKAREEAEEEPERRVAGKRDGARSNADAGAR